MGHGTRGVSIFGKSLISRNWGIPDHIGGMATKPKFDHVVADPKGLRLGRDPLGFVGSIDHFSPLGVGIWGKSPFSRYKGEGSQAVGPACLPAVKPPGEPGLRLERNPVGPWGMGPGGWGSLFRENPCYREFGDTGP